MAAPKPVKRVTRELPPDWFCEGQQDLLDELAEDDDHRDGQPQR